jgi:hypothetical protein
VPHAARALNHAAWTVARWVATGKLEQGNVEDELYAAAERYGLLAGMDSTSGGRRSEAGSALDYLGLLSHERPSRSAASSRSSIATA